MEIQDVRFVKSSPDEISCPQGNLPEYAFVGRSNVGKSSLINYLTDRKNLAKTSAQPGKTKLINHFLVDDCWYLVDLPGYGYAKVSKGERKSFMSLLYNYLERRASMVCLFVLIDSRHAPQNNDLEFIQWLGENQIPFALIFTKTDKLSALKLQQSIEQYKKTLLQTWESFPPFFISSTLAKTGRDEILRFIADTKDSSA